MPDRRNRQAEPNHGAIPYGGRPVDGRRSYGMSWGAAGQPQPQAQPAGYGVPAQHAPVQQNDPRRTFGMGGVPGAPATMPGAPVGAVPIPQYVMPATSQPVAIKPQKKRKRIWIAIAIVVVCLILAGLLAFSLLGLGETKSERQGSLGQLEGKTDAEIQAELDRVVEEGMFNISIASAVQFESGTSTGELRIENVPGNRYLMKVEIMRDDTGEKIYETDLIEPNYHIQSDSLDVDLPAGEYPCTAAFYACDPETEDVVGQAAAKVDISVLS